MRKLVIHTSLLATACTSPVAWRTRAAAPGLDAAGFTNVVRDAMVESLPGTEARIVGPLQLTVHAGPEARTCDLHDAWRTCERFADQRADFVQRQLHGLAPLLRSGPVERETILPTLVRTHDLERLAAAIPDAAVAAQPSLGPLSTALCAPDARGERLLTMTDAAGVATTPEASHQLALDNLRRAGWRLQGDGAVQRLIAGDTNGAMAVSASLLLLDEPWSAMPTPVIAVTPAADQLFFSSGRASDVAALRATLDEWSAGGQPPLSDCYFIRRDGRWSAIEPEEMAAVLAVAAGEEQVEGALARLRSGSALVAKLPAYLQTTTPADEPPESCRIVVQIIAEGIAKSGWPRRDPNHTVHWRVGEQSAADAAALTRELRRLYADRQLWWLPRGADELVPPLVRIDPLPGTRVTGTTGVVLDEAGTPVAGAAVVVLAYRPFY